MHVPSNKSHAENLLLMKYFGTFLEVAAVFVMNI